MSPKFSQLPSLIAAFYLVCLGFLEKLLLSVVSTPGISFLIRLSSFLSFTRVRISARFKLVQWSFIAGPRCLKKSSELNGKSFEHTSSVTCSQVSDRYLLGYLFLQALHAGTKYTCIVICFRYTTCRCKISAGNSLKCFENSHCVREFL